MARKRPPPAPRAPVRPTAEYKRRILAELEGAASRAEQVRILRREGLLKGAIFRWRQGPIQDEIVRDAEGELLPRAVAQLVTATLSCDVDMRGRLGSRLPALALRITVFLLRRHTSTSYREIADALNTNVSTVYYAYPQIEFEMRGDMQLRTVIERLEEKIKPN